MAKITFSRYSEKQFALYNDLWVSLCDLNISVDKLWNNASIDNLIKLSQQIIITRQNIKKGALIIEDGHYNELGMFLDEFENFQFGKKRLMELRKNVVVNRDEIEDVIMNNQNTKQRLSDFLQQMMGCLKNQLRHQFRDNYPLALPE